MPSVVTHATVADGTDLLVRHWPEDDAEAGGAWAGRRGRRCCSSTAWASSRAATSMSASRWPRPAWMSGRTTIAATAAPVVGAATSTAGRSTTTTSRSGSPPSVRAPGGRPVVLYGHSLGGLVVAGYLLTRSAEAGPRRPGLAGLDSTLPGWKKSLAPSLGGSCRPPVPNGIDPTTLSRDPSVGAKAAADPLNATASTARFGAEALTEQARVRGRGPAVSASPRSSSTARTTVSYRWRRQRSSRRTRRRAADLPRSAPRTPQRTRGPAGHRRRHRLAPGQCTDRGVDRSPTPARPPDAAVVPCRQPNTPPGSAAMR